MPEWLTTAVLVAVIAAIGVFAVISYVKKLSKGCCGSGGDEERRVEAAAGELPHEYVVRIGGMTCAKCALRIENGFNRQQGMRAVVDLKNSEARVFTAEPVSELLLRKTVGDLGYSPISVTKNK